MNGKIAAGVIVVTAIVAGVAMYWLQVYAYYDEVKFEPGNEIRLTSVVSGTPEAILAENVTGIDANSSPLRFRACFTTPLSLAMLTVGAALEKGEAVAFLSEHLAPYGMDRVAAVFPDGRGYQWNQISECGKAYYDERDLPAGCPPAPEGKN